MAKKQSIEDGLAEVAKRIANELPDDLMERILAQKLNEALNNLSSSYGEKNIARIVEQSIDAKLNQMLYDKDGEFAVRIEEVARKLGNEAIVIAKQQVAAKPKERRY